MHQLHQSTVKINQLKIRILTLNNQKIIKPLGIRHRKEGNPKIEVLKNEANKTKVYSTTW